MCARELLDRSAGQLGVAPRRRAAIEKGEACLAIPSEEVHHKQFRSHSGDDSELNLITRCYDCHARLHAS